MFNFTDEQLQQLESGQDVILTDDQLIGYIATLKLSLTSMAEEMLSPNRQQDHLGQAYEVLKARIVSLATEYEAGKSMIVPAGFPMNKPYFTDK